MKNTEQNSLLLNTCTSAQSYQHDYTNVHKVLRILSN